MSSWLLTFCKNGHRYDERGDSNFLDGNFAFLTSPSLNLEHLMTHFVQAPTGTRELHSHHFDSSIWNDLQFRDDDIIISTYGKAGTTWTQQIIAKLLFDGDPDLSIGEMSRGG